MSTKTDVPTSSAQITEAAFPTAQNVIIPNPGSGNISLYLAGTGPTLSLYYATNGDSRVLYGQNFGAPTIPLPQGISTYPNANGFNLAWQSTTGAFKLVWGTN